MQSKNEKPIYEDLADAVEVSTIIIIMTVSFFKSPTCCSPCLASFSPFFLPPSLSPLGSCLYPLHCRRPRDRRSWIETTHREGPRLFRETSRTRETKRRPTSRTQVIPGLCVVLWTDRWNKEDDRCTEKGRHVLLPKRSNSYDATTDKLHTAHLWLIKY